MAACPRCGYENTGADFCGNPDCRADLRQHVDAPSAGAVPPPEGTGQRPDEATVRQEVPAGPTWYAPAGVAPERRDTEDDQRRGVRLTADPAQLRVEPGSAASTTVTVRNRGTRVEQFHLTVNGPLAQLVRVQPPVLSVFPDDEQTAEVTFAVPRAPWPPAGVAPFQVVARSDVHTDVADRVAGTVEIGPFVQLGATLEPETTRGRKPGLHRVNLSNRGNVPLQVATELSDRDGELTYDPPELETPVGPGSDEVGEVRVGATKTRWFGKAQSFPFTAMVTAPGAPPVPLNGVRRQVPWFPWWIPIAAAALVALAIAVYNMLPDPTVPVVNTLERTAAVAELESAGYEVGQIEKPDGTVAAGAVIGTQPPGGAPLPRGERVQLMVSTGPCSGPCPVKVPVVDGLAVDDARNDLAAAGFTVDRLDQVQNDRAAGQVVSSNPAGGSMADRGSAVVLMVSTGPPGTPPGEAGAPGAPVPAPAPAPGPAPGPPPAPGPGPGPGPAPGQGGGVEVPDLAGRSAADAEKELKGLGLVAKSTRVPSNAAARNVVVSTDPAAGTAVQPGAAVTLTLADPTGPVSLLREAPEARWEATNGPEVIPLTFPGSEGDGNGYARVDPSASLEDGTTARVLVTHPYWQPYGTIIGTFPLDRPVIAGDHLRARVGFAAGSDDDVEFVVMANGRELARVADTGSDGELKELDADLTPAEGATEVQIAVLAGQRGDMDVAVWKDARIEGQIG